MSHAELALKSQICDTCPIFCNNFINDNSDEQLLSCARKNAVTYSSFMYICFRYNFTQVLQAGDNTLT